MSISHSFLIIPFFLHTAKSFSDFVLFLLSVVVINSSHSFDSHSLINFAATSNLAYTDMYFKWKAYTASDNLLSIGILKPMAVQIPTSFYYVTKFEAGVRKKSVPIMLCVMHCNVCIELFIQTVACLESYLSLFSILRVIGIAVGISSVLILLSLVLVFFMKFFGERIPLSVT